MRLDVKFKKIAGEFNQGFSYQGSFIHFLKSIFGNEFFCRKEFRPYVWSVYFGSGFGDFLSKRGGSINSLNFLFSTGNMDVFTRFYNGLLTNSGITIHGCRYEVYNIRILPLKKFSPCMLFKTLGPCVVPREDRRDKNRQYIIPDKDNIDEFNVVLNRYMRRKYEFLVGGSGWKDIDFSPCGEMKVVIIPYKGGLIKGFKGRFYIESTPEVLKFIYDYGLGVRTGQGFGMLEIAGDF